MKCNHCGKHYTEEEIEAKRKKKSELIKLARKEARERGEQVGRRQVYDRVEILMLRKEGLSIRQIAKRIGSSVTPVHKTLKDTK